eukprot:31225-Pelagococcus_subviridis.AAC.2
MHATSAAMDVSVVSCGHTTTVNAIVAILFKTPTSVNVVAVMTVRTFQPQYEMPTPMAHDARSHSVAFSPRTTSLA